MTYLKYECSEYKSKEKNDIVTNDKTSGDLTYAWLATTSLFYFKKHVFQGRLKVS